MIKKTNILLMVLSPLLFGWLFNYFCRFLPFLFISPILYLIYWFWIGMYFQENIKKPIKSILIANSVGIISLLLYYWQFNILVDKDRIIIIAAISQMFSAPLSYITAKIGLMFEKSPNEVTSITSSVMQISGLLLMVAVFFFGFIYKKYYSKKYVK